MMIAIDTNVLVRFLVNDDKKQGAIAASLIDGNQVFISKTVMLEAEWVLRACYDIPVGQIALAFEGLLGVPHITMDESNDMAKAIVLYKLGMDFGDAMHLLAGKSAKKFVSFDKKMIKKAVALGINTVALAE